MKENRGGRRREGRGAVQLDKMLTKRKRARIGMDAAPQGNDHLQDIDVVQRVRKRLIL